MILTNEQRSAVRYWLPGITAGAVAWLMFMTLGQTSIIRASGLALVIIGMTMTLRRWGAVLAFIGGLALALSPTFWSQMGGTDSLSVPVTVLVLCITGALTLLIIRFSRHWFFGLIIGFAIFSALFWSQLSTQGSLRLTTLATAWLLYLLVDAQFITNPHPGDPPAALLQPRHTLGMLILLTVGVINTPLFILLVPAVILGLVLARARLSWLYWLGMGLILIAGLYGIATEYISSTWWSYPAAQAQAQGFRVPFMLADGWREAVRWVNLVNLVVEQFTVFGVVLGIIGLSRLARWYPPLGTVTMIAYAAHVLFGLAYFGRDSAVLLLPLMMIQILWMTYAIYAFGEWLQRSVNLPNYPLRWFAPALYVWLPLLMLARITGTL